MNFNFSPKVFYPLLLAVLVVGVVLYTQFGETQESNTIAKTQTNKMPMDEAHNGMGGEGTPSSANVSKDFLQEVETLKQKVEANPKDTLSMREYAELLHASHKQDLAIKYYEKILNINPKRTDIMFALSIVYFDQQNFGKSEEYVNKILTIDKNDHQVIYNLGVIAATLGNKEKARSVWEDIIKRFPGTETSSLARESLDRL